MSSSDSENDAPLQISVKKPSTNMKKDNKNSSIKQIGRSRTTKIKKQTKEEQRSIKTNQLRKRLKAELKQKFQQQKIIEQLKKFPINLGNRENKVIKIQDVVSQKKAIKQLGIQLVQRNRQQIRKPDPKLAVKIDKNHKLRGNFLQILALKRAKR